MEASKRCVHGVELADHCDVCHRDGFAETITVKEAAAKLGKTEDEVRTALAHIRAPMSIDRRPTPPIKFGGNKGLTRKQRLRRVHR